MTFRLAPHNCHKNHGRNADAHHGQIEKQEGWAIFDPTCFICASCGLQLLAAHGPHDLQRAPAVRESRTDGSLRYRCQHTQPIGHRKRLVLGARYCLLGRLSPLMQRLCSGNLCCCALAVNLPKQEKSIKVGCRVTTISSKTSPNKMLLPLIATYYILDIGRRCYI